jgi:hypothetical protein
MKKLFALAAIAAAATAPAHALTTGDIAFTAFNADEDGWSLVTFVDLAANTKIYFTDGTASSATAIGGGESAFSWDTGSAVVAAGTVVRFSAIDVAGRAVSVGTFIPVNSTNFGLNATAETIYAFLGSSNASGSTVTTMLTAVSSEANNTSLTTVGLTAGTNAIKLTSSADFAGYTGVRTGLSSFAAYAPLVNNAANWAINVNGDGTSVVPDTTVFAAVPEPETYALMLAGLAAVGLMARRRA